MVMLSSSFSYNCVLKIWLYFAFDFRYISEVTDAFYARRDWFIKFPVGHAAQVQSAKFQAKAHFPGIVGLIDGTHIRIKPPKEDAEAYENRKGYHSINCQVTVDADDRITSIDAKWPGRTHDARVYRNSELRERFETGDYTGILLGDSGYACSNVTVTPKMAPITQSDHRFNRAHRGTRCGIECVFGQMK